MFDVGFNPSREPRERQGENLNPLRVSFRDNDSLWSRAPRWDNNSEVIYVLCGGGSAEMAFTEVACLVESDEGVEIWSLHPRIALTELSETFTTVGGIESFCKKSWINGRREFILTLLIDLWRSWRSLNVREAFRSGRKTLARYLKLLCQNHPSFGFEEQDIFPELGVEEERRLVCTKRLSFPTVSLVLSAGSFLLHTLLSELNCVALWVVIERR